MVSLPIRKMVLYKHGVGFFQREGQFQGSEIELTFRHDEINDVLKSLAIFDRSGGQILGMQYQTPLDTATRLKDSSIRLAENSSLQDLLKSLRGRTVELRLKDEEILPGQLIGIDLDEESPHENSLVSIRMTDSSQVRVVPISTVTGVEITDATAARDLRFFLDTSLSEDARRSVLLQLSEGSHDLLVYYVAPSPTWRVSYRLVIESDPAGGPGRGLLQGWGLFENHLPEDLEQVTVTLVAGQPISFIYDLYSSHVPERPIVKDESRVAQGPVEYSGSLLKRVSKQPSAGSAPMMAMASAPAPAARMPAPDVDAFSVDEAVRTTPVSAETRETGELFQYDVITPVNVRRGESALVPILGVEIQTHKELLYNPAKLRDHPVAAVRFDNSTNLTLERGPVTVIEDGDYRGEAIVPFTKPDNEIHLAYAIERGVRATIERDSQVETHALHFEQRFLVIEQYLIEQSKVVLENTTGSDVVVTVEAATLPTYELFDTPEPDITTPREWRWHVSIQAHDQSIFMWKVRKLKFDREDIRKLTYRHLQALNEGGWLGKGRLERLTGVIDRLAGIQKATDDRHQLADERNEIYEREKQLRENLSALQAKGEEGKLRSRVLSQLEACEDRLTAIETQLADLTALIAKSEEEIEQAIKQLAGTKSS